MEVRELLLDMVSHHPSDEPALREGECFCGETHADCQTGKKHSDEYIPVYRSERDAPERSMKNSYQEVCR
jgi:hypothetical protein